ncbi:MAG: FtsW/RodA/SpoVE family cell cycle protein [Eubacterium sp.]|jgi:rod shape determining protein RodA|nr:FtsW/RodA/SpoVE family cell cycle protein [Eubacterium sp.]
MKKTLKIFWGYIKRLDLILLISCIVAGAFACFLLYSLYESGIAYGMIPRHYKMQILTTALGVVFMLIIAGINYRLLSKIWFTYAPLSVILTLLVFTPLGLTPEGTDNVAWVDLGFTSIQPSEFLKLAFIMTFSTHVAKVGDKLNKLPQLGLLLLHAAIPLGLIVVQGDDGTALVFGFMVIIMLFSAGLWWRYIAIGLTAIPVAAYALWNYVMLPYQQKRFLVLFDTELQETSAMYDQQRASLIAMGSGGMTGKGLFGGEYYYVPAVHTDFIFSYIGMTLGLIGCVAVISLFLLILGKMLHGALSAKDLLGRSICVGVFSMILFHCIINIGMVVAVVPVIGIPLPFFSAGGSSNLVTFLAMGLVLSVYSHKEKKYHMFFTEKD